MCVSACTLAGTGVCVCVCWQRNRRVTPLMVLLYEDKYFTLQNTHTPHAAASSPELFTQNTHCSLPHTETHIKYSLTSCLQIQTHPQTHPHIHIDNHLRIQIVTVKLPVINLPSSYREMYIWYCLYSLTLMHAQAPRIQFSKSTVLLIFTWPFKWGRISFRDTTLANQSHQVPRRNQNQQDCWTRGPE